MQSTSQTNSSTAKLHKTIADYGSLPLEGTPGQAQQDQDLQPTPSTLLALVLDALLKSTRISHDLAQKTVNAVLRAGYHDIDTLSASTFDDRVRVLSEGGYTRYREQTATRLGELAEWVEEKYGMDASILVHNLFSPRMRTNVSVFQTATSTTSFTKPPASGTRSDTA